MGLPIYQQIKQEILDDIQNQPVNTPVLSERALSTRFNASRMTVRRAIDELVEEGYLYRDSNKGTFIADKSIRKRNSTIEEYDVEDEVSYRLLYFDVKSSSSLEVQNELNISPDDSVVRLIRLALVKNVPQCVEEFYIRRLDLSDKEFGDLPKAKSLNYFISQGRMRQRFVPTYVPVQYANLLKMKLNDPIILMENLVNRPNGKPIVFMKVYNNPNEKIIEITI